MFVSGVVSSLNGVFFAFIYERGYCYLGSL